jgi:hypothetical protein
VKRFFLSAGVGRDVKGWHSLVDALGPELLAVPARQHSVLACGAKLLTSGPVWLLVHMS